MTQYVNVHRLQIDRRLYDFVETEALPGTGVQNDAFWSGFDRLIHDLAPRNAELLHRRDTLQRQLDEWHLENRDRFDFAAYKTFLLAIGYLEPDVEDFQISTANVDDEVALQAGPQLVVPVNNARYALNAANARWGSLYDALYGTDAIGDEDGAGRISGYNAVRGAKSLHSRGISWIARSRSIRVRTLTRCAMPCRRGNWRFNCEAEQRPGSGRTAS